MNFLRIVLIICAVILCSCNSFRHFGFNIVNYQNLRDANEISLNEDYSTYIPTLSITDNNIYTVLDSVIHSTVYCKNYSKKLSAIFSFTVLASINKKSNNIRYRISPELSVKTSLENKKNLKGGFYYKGYLFMVRESNKLESNNSSLFYIVKNCELKVYAWDFKSNKAYMPLAVVEKVNNSYKITHNNLCGDELYVTDNLR